MNFLYSIVYSQGKLNRTDQENFKKRKRKKGCRLLCIVFMDKQIKRRIPRISNAQELAQTQHDIIPKIKIKYDNKH